MRDGRFCATLFRTVRKSLILNGEMSEWLKEHAWKANPESLTERHRDSGFHTDSVTCADSMFVGVRP
jgi:hypothetical protein